MGFVRTTTSQGGDGGFGMGFLLVFFPGDEQDTRRRHKFNPFCSPLRRALFGHLLVRAQTTAFICLLLFFSAVLFFTVSTLPPSNHRIYGEPRRMLVDKTRELRLPHALQGMGTLYRRGTAAMTDIVVVHAAESLSLNELKLFIRLFLRSDVASRSDLVFVFTARKASIDDVILQENDDFLKILSQYRFNLKNDSQFPASFDVSQFLKTNRKAKERGESIWGKRIKSNSVGGDTELNRPSYGSVVGFEAEELDPENSLSGFVDHAPISLRRWACYPMLLGRVKRNFKHIMLFDPKAIWLIGDPLSRFRSHRPESVILNPTVHQGRHAKKSPSSTRSKPVHPGIIMGGSKGVRRLSNTMLIHIVNAALQRRRKNSVSELGVFNQLIENEFILNDVRLIMSDEPIVESSSLSGSSYLNHSLVRRAVGDQDIVSAVVMKHICSFPIDSLVHRDCYNMIQ